MLRGDRFDKPTYSILRSLSGGSVGEVRLVRHAVFDKPCVQKTYSTLGLEDALANQEPRLLHELDHPHVVEVLEAQWDPDDDSAITFVAIYYEGGSIADALEDDYRFSVHQALRIAVQILDALGHIHVDPRYKIVHRDIKPANIFLDADRQHSRLGDWGSAAPMRADGTVASIEGTPLYTAPEGGPTGSRISLLADLYSVAFTLFEMLNGPFDYESIAPERVDERLTQGRPALPASAFKWAPHVCARIRAVVRKGLRTAPIERYSSAAEFIAAIRAVQCIDWRHTIGAGIDGLWEGTWPPQKTPSHRRRYRVRSYVLTGGRYRGLRRVEAYQAVSASSTFARFGVDDVTLVADDDAGVARFFAAVEAKAAQLMPAS